MEGKTCIVTGGGSGIGRATCVAFAQRKVNVVVVDVNESAGRETEQMIKSSGGTACFVQCDVTNEQGKFESQPPPCHSHISCFHFFL